MPDTLNFAPRVGVTWAPFKSGKTTLRGSWGMFYDWLPTGTYQQTLQIDGFRLREENIVNPSFPDPGDVGSTPPTNRYLLADERDMAYSQRLSAGIAQTISRRLNTNVLYSYGYRYALLTGRNLNTPINGVQARSRLRQRRARDRRRQRTAAQHERVGEPQPGAVAANRRAGGGGGGGMIMMQGGPMMIMMGGPGGGPAATGPRFVWNRGLTLSGFYTYGQQLDNTDGAFVDPREHLPRRRVGAIGIRPPPQHAPGRHQHGAPELQCPSRSSRARPRRR